MRIAKGTLAAILAMAMLMCGVLGASAGEFITDEKDAFGRFYTDSEKLASALGEIFAGDIDLFRDAACTKELLAPLGTSYMTGSRLCCVRSPITDKVIMGWQCYIYANAVYNKLFGETVGHGDEDYIKSEVVIGKGAKEASYEMFAEAGVVCGAYMRTSANSDGSYNGTYGHSLIVLAYDAYTITYLDGNSDGDGLVRINVRSWEEFNDVNLSGRGRRISHVVQPKSDYYQKRYPTKCTHEGHERGDVTGDGIIDARDYILAKRAVLGTYQLTAEQRAAMDVDANGKVGTRDYILIKRHVMKTYVIVTA